jgi:hypothetical protein
MELVLILGLLLTATGVLVGLYLPFVAPQFAKPERIRLLAIVAAILVAIGMACEVFAVWPVEEIEIEQQRGWMKTEVAYLVFFNIWSAWKFRNTAIVRGTDSSRSK